MPKTALQVSLSLALLALSVSSHPAALAAEPEFTPIYTLQGPSFVSPFKDQKVQTRGVVTAVGEQGFYLQDSAGDGRDETSDGIFVRQQHPEVVQGSHVGVWGTVREETVKDPSIGLTRTTLVAEQVQSYRNQVPFPKAVRLGQGGRTIPKAVISMFRGNLNTKKRLNPAEGLDFCESLEGMLVEINRPRLTAAGSPYGDLFAVADEGAAAFPSLNARYSLLLFAEGQDYNPEILNFKNPHDRDVQLSGAPAFRAEDYHKGDLFLGPVTGILDYNTTSHGSYFVGGYFIYPTAPLPPVQSAHLHPESTDLKSGPRQLTLANYNLENFTVQNPPENPDKVQAIARHIARNLQAPDILMLQEVADNDGYAKPSSVTAANRTLQQLCDEIRKAGGPVYDFAQIDPENGADGGLPNANIRVAYLYQPGRVQLAHHPAGDTHTAVQVQGRGELSLNPGRIEPDNPIFKEGRKSLAAEFLFQGQSLILVNNHLKSKRGDTPLWSAQQPPVFHSEVQRKQQGAVLHHFVQEILKRNPQAHIVLAGDFNDSYASPVLQQLKAGVLDNLVEDLPFNERYTYVYKGSSQTLDQFLVSKELHRRWHPEVDVVHLNAEFSPADYAESDHDPIVVRLTLPE